MGFINNKEEAIINTEDAYLVVESKSEHSGGRSH